MNQKEEIERRIELKEQLIMITVNEISELHLALIKLDEKGQVDVKNQNSQA